MELPTWETDDAAFGRLGICEAAKEGSRLEETEVNCHQILAYLLAYLPVRRILIGNLFVCLVFFLPSSV